MASLGFTRRAGTPLQITPRNTKTNYKDARTQKYKYENKYRHVRTKIQIQKQTQRGARTNMQVQQKRPKRTNKYKHTTKTQLNIQIRIHNRNARNPNTPENRHRGRLWVKKTRSFFFARGLVCANTPKSALRDKTMCGHSKWSQFLALVPYSGW